jgi:hypothetical protein
MTERELLEQFRNTPKDKSYYKLLGLQKELQDLVAIKLCLVAELWRFK